VRWPARSIEKAPMALLAAAALLIAPAPATASASACTG
jgi:hypothetical protein